MNSTYEHVETRYGRLTVLAQDTGAVTQSLRKYGEWAANELSFLCHFAHRGCTVVDVGAYIGTHTLAFAKAVGSGGRVIAFEAQPAAFEALGRNVAAHQGGLGEGQSAAIQLEYAVAASEPGQVAIPVLDVDASGSFGSASLVESLKLRVPSGEAAPSLNSGLLMVRAVTIDSLNLESCCLVKLDVEGAEDLVLQGAIETIRRCSPILYCECNSLAQGLRTLDVLRSVEYLAFAHVVDAFNEDNFRHDPENVFGEAREVALVGVPASRLAELRAIPVRPVERLLEIEDADDLVLALLNKPQYQPEVLRVSRAAQTGGARFLDHYQELELQLPALRSDLEAQRERSAQELLEAHRLLTARTGDVEGLRRQLQERGAELLEVHTLLTARTSDVEDLQRQLRQRGDELAEVHRLLTARTSDIEHLKSQLWQRGDELSEVHRLLGIRDGAISALQAQATERDQKLAGVQQQLQRKTDESTHLIQEINELKAEIANQLRITAEMKFAHSELDSRLKDVQLELDRKGQDLERAMAFISDLVASRSWRVTQPLRWVRSVFGGR